MKKNFLYNFITRLVTTLAPLVVLPYISRVFNTTYIGIYNYIYALVSVFALFSDVGISAYGVPIIAKSVGVKKKSQCFEELLLIRFIFTSFIIIVYAICVAFIFEEMNTTYYILFGFHILSVMFDITWFYQAMEDYKTICIRTLITKLLAVSSTFIFVNSINDFNIYIIITIMSALLPNILMFFNLKKYIKIERYNLNIKRHIKPIFSLFLPGIAYTLYSLVDKIMIKEISNNIGEVGYYELAYKIAFIGVTIVSVFSTVFSSRISNIDNDDEIKKLQLSSFSIFSYVTILIFVGLISLSDYFIPFYYGDGYDKSITILKVFSVLPLIVGTSHIISYEYFVPKLKTKYMIYIVFGSILVNVVFNTILIRNMGGLGAAIATIISELFMSVVYLIIYSKYQNMKELFCRVYKYFISGIITSIIIFLAISKFPCINFTIFITYVGLITLIYTMLLAILKEKFIIEKFKKIYRMVRRIQVNEK